MHTYDAMLEPFEARTLAAIRAAFQAGWDELCRQVPHADLFLRNRLIGAIANLAQSGIDDPRELKRRALHRLRIGTVAEAPAHDTSVSGLHVGAYFSPDLQVAQGAVQP